MEPLNDNINTEGKSDNQKVLDEKMRKKHTEDLGLGMPEDYFSKSKKEILEKVGANDSSRVVPMYRNKVFWATAAAVLVLIVLTLFKTNTVPQIEEIPAIVSDTLEQLDNGLVNEDFEQHENDILISSLFVTETEIDELADNYMLKEALLDEKIDFNQ